MKSPDDWDLLTSAISAVGLTKPEFTWTFLVELQLVGNRVTVHRQFLDMVQEVLAEGVVTGPTPAERVAARLRVAGHVQVAAYASDPGGERANAALVSRSSAPRQLPPPVAAPFDHCFCGKCGARTGTRYSEVHQCQSCGQPPLDQMALLLELGMSSLTHQRCPNCASANALDRYCYYCGLDFHADS